ncbi:MAG TPA: SCP2 sterol-binding domain-containing protein [Candidatus Thermoplasmatota archaeon]|nr:SCP2 sterol-binding domain-containing protein [Candidatus Thermoplasmatota archaeon]
MATPYFTKAYFDALATTLNADAEFQAKTANLKANLLMVARDKGEKGAAFLLAVDHGKAAITEATPETSAEFAFIGDYATWVRNHQGEAPLEKLVMTGKMKFKGSIPKIMQMRNQLGVIDTTARRVPAAY